MISTLQRRTVQNITPPVTLAPCSTGKAPGRFPTVHRSVRAIGANATMAVALIWIATLFPATGEAGDAAVPPERRPYDVRLLVAFDATGFDDDLKRVTFRNFELAAQRCVGELWSLTLEEILWLCPVNESGLGRLDESALDRHFGDMPTDIRLVATVESRSVGHRVSVRSWQPEVRTQTAAISIDVTDHREIAVSLLRLCRDQIRPMGLVEHVDERTVRIRLRAGELSSPDPSFSQLAAGDLMVPMLAYRNKNRVIEKLQSIPWTYVTIDRVDGSSVTATVQSGLRLALGGKKRGRIDTLVVGLRPQWASTKLELYSQTKPPLPLVAHRLEIRSEQMIPRVTDEHPDANPASTLLTELLTDRRGLAEVAIQPDHRLVWLFAYSGQHMLARIPFVPGSFGEARLEVPDDAVRLSTEADLQMLQSEVIDAVALRNTAVATIRAAAKKDDWTTVNQKLKLLKKQQKSAELSERLVAIRVAGVAVAKSRKDRAAETRINRMCDETATLVAAHLGDEKLRLLHEEMDALQSADAASQDAK